ncbi:S8/S53 family peptidase [Methylobacterium sp. NMS12]|uniref:S8 family peptidase n=1 Tax=Methylobacterium sp. NMS12 TaxID=3079766 RepID=UPI003F884AF0
MVVGVCDTGIEEVDELQGRIRGAYRIDRTLNRVEPTERSRDTQGHGTHVAGLICGATVGVAPAAQVENIIMIPGGSGNLSDFILAIEHVAQQPHISVLNMSAGIPGYNGEMQPALDALRRVGVLSVIAIGNEGRNTSRSPGNYRSVLSVGASNEAGHVAAFSGGGQMMVDGMTYAVPDCVAPGEQVTSCVMDGGFEAWDGTSMATPVVSGLAALLIERDPSITIAELEDQILSACIKLEAPEARQGAGLVQYPASLAVAAVGGAVVAPVADLGSEGGRAAIATSVAVPKQVPESVENERKT